MAGSLTDRLVTPLSGSDGVTFNAATRTLTWNPNAAVAKDFVLRVTDPHGAFTEQRFTLAAIVRVAPSNPAPVIRSVPVSPTQLGDVYSYPVEAYDPNGDTLTYSLTTKPAGMSIDSAGRITWKSSQTGNYNVTVAVSDGVNSAVTQSYTLTVQAPVAANEPPEITSSPTGPAVRNLAWAYAAKASDPNGDTIVWTLDTSAVPAAAIGNLQINGSTGVITWTPEVDGSFELKVTADDQHGGVISQAFTLPVLKNAPPRFTSTAVTSVDVGQNYFYDANASDPNPGDTLTFALDTASLNRGLSINGSTGEIAWTNATPAGTYSVTVTVADQDGAKATQPYSLKVADPNTNHAPVINSQIRDKLQVGTQLIHQVDATDADGDALTYSLLTPPAGMTIDSAGLIQWTPSGSQIGDHSFTVRVSDGRANGTVDKSFTISVVNEVVNNAPSFTTNPKTNLVKGTAYSYDANATDPDGDTLVFSLVTAPSAMTIDAQSGVIRWTPTASDVGTHTLTVRVADTQGLAVEQTVTLTVRETNRAPNVTSDPPTVAVRNKAYAYAVKASDPDGHSLKFTLGNGTSAAIRNQTTGAAAIDPATGVLTWTPDTLGTFRIQINVVDELGLGVAQIYDVEVLATAPNDPPRFDTTPGLSAEANTQYIYDADATDPNGDSLTYSLLAPDPVLADMSFNTTTGRLTWTPSAGQVNDLITFSIKASDGSKSATQDFSVRVTPQNVTPSITSIPDRTVSAGATFRYDVRATDANGDALTYSLTVGSGTLDPAPSIDAATGRITWSPTIAQISTTPYTATVTVSDGRLTATDTFTITVTADTTAPVAEIVVSVGQVSNLSEADIGQELTIRVHATDNVGVASKTLTLASRTFGGSTTTLNQALSLSHSGEAKLTLTAEHLGLLTFTATATDAAGNIGTAPNESLNIFDPADDHPPTANIITPLTRTSVTEPIDIIGSIAEFTDGTTHDDPTGLTWTLTATPLDSLTRSVSEGGTGSTRVLATGSGEITNQIVGRFDPTLLRNGTWTVTLTATDAGGNVAADSINLEVEGGLKLGNFTVSFVDMTIPVPGFPITLTRTYDTLDADAEHEFGYGWKLDLANTKLHIESGDGSQSGRYVPFEDGTRVVITLPDGTKEGFSFYPEQQIAGGMIRLPDYLPRFIPDVGVKSELIVDQRYIRKPSTTSYIDMETGEEYSPVNPALGGLFTLKLRNGTELVIDGESGDLLSLTDLNGNTLTFTGTSIESNSGRTVQFEHDDAGRITAITDPRGKSIFYTYDVKGNLTAVTDRVGATTTFTYLPSANTSTITGSEHYLDEIRDPFGRPAAKTEYDDSGRISKITDAAGKTTEYIWNGDSKVQKATDQLGNVTFITNDSRGNVFREDRPEGGITLRTFDDEDRILTETIVVGAIDSAANGELNDQSTTHIYNANGDEIETIDSRGNVNRVIYGSRGEVISTTDSFGNTSNKYYDSRGLLSSVVDPFGNVTSMSYDDSGNVTSVRNHSGNTLMRNSHNRFGETTSIMPVVGELTYFDYDSNGNLIATWYFDGNGSNQTQILHVSTYDDTGNITATERAILPSGQFITANLATATVPLQFIEWSNSTTFNASGQIASTTDQYGFIAENTYDLRGQQIQTRRQALNESGATVWLLARSAYDAAGRTVAQTDSFVEGSTAPITGSRSTYDGAGRVIKSERVTGLVIDLVGSSAGLRSVVSSNGTVVSSSRSEFDNAGRVVKSFDNFGLETRSVFNAEGETVETRRHSIDETGATVWLVSRAVYDSYGRAQISTDQYLEGSSAPIFGTETIYDDLGRAISTVRRSGVVIALSNGESSLSSAGTILWSTLTEYDNDGRVSRTVAADGQTSRNVYDSLGRQVATIGHPLPATEVGLTGYAPGTTVALRSDTIYNSNGRTFQQRANLRHITAPDGTVTIDASAVQTTTFAYDKFGNQIKTTFNDGTFVEIAYDHMGRKTSETNQLGQTRSLEYDSAGRLKTVTLPGVLNPATGQIERPRYEYGYDANGNQTVIKDPLGHETRFTFDAQNRQSTRTLPLGFGLDGRFGTADDPVAWTPSSVPSATPFTERMEYDDLGRMRLAISFEGVVTEYVYSPTTGRMTSQRFFDNLAAYNTGSGTPSEIWTVTHDAFGREVSVARYSVSSGQTLTTTNSFDTEGHLIQVASPEGTLSYTYNNIGRLTSTIIGTPSSPQRITSYTYDTLGRLKGVTEDQDATSTIDQVFSTNYGYDLLGNLDRTDMPNGVITDYAYDSMNRLDTLTHYAPDATPNDLSNNTKLSEFDYTVQNDGRRTHATERFWKDGASNAPLVNEIDWTYDALGRLITEGFDSTDNALDYRDDYSLDLTGNRLSKTQREGASASANVRSTTTSTYDANDRVLTESQVTATGAANDRFTTYAYGATNAATQQTGKTVHAGNAATLNSRLSSLDFSYDLQGRLAVATNTTFDGNTGAATQVTSTAYDYNTTSIRVAALTETDANADGNYETRVLTQFLNDANNHTGYSQVIRSSEYDANTNTLQKTTDYSFGHDELTQTTTTFDTNGNITGRETVDFGHDGHGSVRMLTNMAAAIAQLFAYDAYGQLLAIFNASGQRISGGNGQLADATQAITNLLYSGEQFDTRIGQQYLRARYYDASIGRFNRLDPFFGLIADPQSLHKYSYTHNDPITGVDPTGREFSIGGMLGAIAIGFNHVSQEVTSGGIVLGLLEVGGKPAFDAREAGLLLVSAGEIERGFALYNLGGRIAAITFDTIGGLDDAISFGTAVPLALVGAVLVIAKFRDLPDIVQSLVRFAKRNAARWRSAGAQGTQSAAQTLATRAAAIRAAIPDTQVAVTVVRIRNGNQQKILVARNGEKNILGSIPLNPGEERVAGYGKSVDGWHAEANIAEKLRELNNKNRNGYDGDWVIQEGGVADAVVCPEQCQTLVDAFGLKLNGNAFWRE